MSRKAKTEIDLTGSAGGLRSEPGGRAQRPAGAARLREERPPLELPDEVRDRLAAEVIVEPLAGRRSEAVMDGVREWQQRPLDDVYPVVFLDALVLKIREGGTVQRRACYLALGVTVEGERDVLGMWFQETEGAKFWMQVLSELKQRGVSDILLCCVDGLKGFPEAIEAIYPTTTVQTCVVHLIRHSLKYVPRRDREQA